MAAAASIIIIVNNEPEKQVAVLSFRSLHFRRVAAFPARPERWQWQLLLPSRPSSSVSRSAAGLTHHAALAAGQPTSWRRTLSVCERGSLVRDGGGLPGTSSCRYLVVVLAAAAARHNGSSSFARAEPAGSRRSQEAIVCWPAGIAGRPFNYTGPGVKVQYLRRQQVTSRARSQPTIFTSSRAGSRPSLSADKGSSLRRTRVARKSLPRSSSHFAFVSREHKNLLMVFSNHLLILDRAREPSRV